MGDLIKKLFNGLDVYFVDLNTKIVVFNYHKKQTFEYNGNKYALNHSLVKNNALFYHSKIAEPLEYEYNENKTEYYVTTDEFKSICDNKVLKQLMYVNEKSVIQIILLIVLILVVINIFLGYQINEINSILQSAENIETLSN
jgi:hypothetical protein